MTLRTTGTMTATKRKSPTKARYRLFRYIITLLFVIGSVTSLLSVTGRLVGRPVGHNFLKGGILHFQAPIGALVISVYCSPVNF